MLGFRFRGSPDAIRQKAADRLSTVSRGEALDWVDTALAGAWKSLEEYRKDPQIIYLDDAEQGLQMALGAVDNLRRRTF